MQKEIPQRPPRVPVPNQRSDAFFQMLCEGGISGQTYNEMQANCHVKLMTNNIIDELIKELTNQNPNQ